MMLILAVLFHGLVLAFLALAIATFTEGVTRRMLILFACCALIYQGGCTYVAEGMTRGHGFIYPITIVGIGLAVIWWLWLVMIPGSNDTAVTCPSCGLDVPKERDKCKRCGWSKSLGWPAKNLRDP